MLSASEPPKRQSGGSRPWRKRTSLMPKVYHARFSSSPMPWVPSPPTTPDQSSPEMPAQATSSSGLLSSMEDNALSQYTSYKTSERRVDHRSGISGLSTGLYMHSSSDESQGPRRFATAPRWTRGRGYGVNAFATCLPFLDFLGKETFQMAMEDPSVVKSLTSYCEKAGFEENMTFLTKIREYTESTNSMSSTLLAISTSYTTLIAKRPLDIPPVISRVLNTDVKRIAHSVIPALEAVFKDATSHIESRLARDIFPGFVKSQLVSCLTAELATDDGRGQPLRSEYPGLGTSFCLTDAMAGGNPIVSASKAFARMTGRTLPEVIGLNYVFLQGPMTDPAAACRLQCAMRDGREALELVLNFGKQGEPFWNLVFLFPLSDRQGRVQYWLVGQVNVSQTARTWQDLLRVLGGGSGSADADDTTNRIGASIGFQSLDMQRLELDDPTESSTGDLKRTTSRSSQSSRRSTRSRLFGTFRKRVSRDTLSTLPDEPTRPVPDGEATPSKAPRALQAADFAQDTKHRQSPYPPLSQSLPRADPLHVEPTPYSPYMVLRCMRQTSAAPSILGRPTSTSGGSRRERTKLRVAFYSEAATSLLGVRSDITHVDIFRVLEDKANATTVTRGFRAALRERLEAGQTATAALLLEPSRHLLGRRRHSSASHLRRPSQSDLREGSNAARSATADEQAGRKTPRPSRTETVFSHWVPLRSGVGAVEWVVLILSATGPGTGVAGPP